MAFPLRLHLLLALLLIPLLHDSASGSMRTTLSHPERRSTRAVTGSTSGENAASKGVAEKVPPMRTRPLRSAPSTPLPLPWPLPQQPKTSLHRHRRKARRGRQHRARAHFASAVKTRKMSTVDRLVRRNGTQLLYLGKPFFGNGFNAYWLMYMASIPEQRKLVDVALKQARKMGVTVCRTWAFYDGPGWHALQTAPGVFDESTFQALDYVIATAYSYGIRVHLVLANNWGDFGGKPQYLQWSQQAGSTLPGNDQAFYLDPLCRQMYKNFVEAVILRRNTVNGLVYRDDPFIFAWELINEPRINSDPSGNVLQAWIEEMAAHVKSLDPNHLLSVGSEGFYGPSSPQRQGLNGEAWMASVGTDFIRNNRAPGVDLASIHAYANSRSSAGTFSAQLGYYLPYIQGHLDDCASALNKPLLVGEFGPSPISTPLGALANRDLLYNATYAILLKAKQPGAASSVGFFWQLMVDEITDWNDGLAVFFNSQPSTVAIIGNQSLALLS